MQVEDVSFQEKNECMVRSMRLVPMIQVPEDIDISGSDDLPTHVPFHWYGSDL